MRAAVIKEHGGPESIHFEERPVPAPRAGEVLVRVKACGLNHLDAWVRRGVDGHKFPLPIVPGSDIAGTVESEGDLKGARVLVNPSLSCGQCVACQAGSDHLCAKWGLLGETQDGGCQEFICVKKENIFHLPQHFPFEQAACVPIAYVTAWQMLVGKARALTGETVLIHGAGSGVSIACIQIAKLLGLQIYVTSNSDEKLQRTKALGAHRFINTSKEPFREAIKNLTGKQGVDIVVDHVGEVTFNDSVRCLKRGGRLVSCGATTGANLKLDWKMIFFKNLSLLGSTYGPRSDFQAVMERVVQHKLVPVMDSRVRLDELPKAHAALESRAVFGKIVVVM